MSDSGVTLGGSWRAGRHLSLLIALTTILSLAYVRAPGAASDTGLRLIGKLPQPKEARDILTFSGAKVALVNSAERKLYYIYARSDLASIVREYDLTKRIPQPGREAQLANVNEMSPFQAFSPGTVVLDSKRRRMLILSNSGSPAGCPGDPGCGTALPSPMKIFVFDLNTFRRTTVFNVQVSIPGLLPVGMTYSAQDDRLYLAGEIQPGGLVGPYFTGVTAAGPPRRPPIVAAAMNPENGSMLWVKPIPECENLLASQEQGLFMARSSNLSALYFACVRSSVWPGTTMLVRLWIDPKGTTASAPSFPIEFFPIAGGFTNEAGIRAGSSFDYASERFFLQSMALRTPGAWVFDGRLSAWVGFITAPDDTDVFGGVQPATGRYYVGGEGLEATGGKFGYLVVSDARQTPVPQGSIFNLPGILKSPIYVDAPTRRIFVWIDPPTTGELDYEWLIYEDRIPASQAEETLDYDVLTDDIPESDKTFATFAGDTHGFGARISLVGGYLGVTSFCAFRGDNPCDPSDPAFLEGFGSGIAEAGPPPPSAATRELSLGRVPSIDVRNVGASAVAQALAPDPVTDGEYRERIQEDLSESAGARAGEERGKQVNDALAWPHPLVTCLDSGGAPAKSDSLGMPGSGASVDCDLEKETATATSSFSAGAFTNSGLEISIASGSFAAKVHRDPRLGILTDSTAVAKGIDIRVAGVGSISISRITTTAKTAARGRTGTTSVAWGRTFEGVLIKDAQDGTTYRCSDADSCDPRQIVNQMNTLLQTRAKVRLPTPELIKSPKGAFAAVQEPSSDFLVGLVTNEDNLRAVPGLEITFYNDAVEKSRVVLQLAAIQSSSIYGISLVPPEGGVDPGAPLPIPSLGPLPDIPGVPNPDGGFVPPGPSSVNGTSLIRSAWLLVRSPKDALLFGLTALLFAGAVVAAWRRRLLIGRLGGGG